MSANARTAARLISILARKYPDMLVNKESGQFLNLALLCEWLDPEEEILFGYGSIFYELDVVWHSGFVRRSKKSFEHQAAEIYASLRREYLNFYLLVLHSRLQQEYL